MEPKDNRPENGEAPVKPIEAPAGLELHPAPKQSVRLNRRASLGVGAIALLLLLAVYGLRSGEIIRLRLDDFDWDREVFTVTRSKSLRSQPFPLSPSVAAALIRYLKEVRPRTPRRELFLTHCAPLRPIDRATVFLIVARRLRVVCPALAHHGPHALRHACATHLLNQGLSLKEIGDYLGHRHPESTRIYTKVDLRGLRQVADFDLGGLL